ncbi:hypothetical protein [Bacillus fungorum]|uniref:hypothetical protein n=1 Tax=Bacillus fungorum TaxID=2039284 RepID=UPI003F54E2E4
MRYGLGYAYSSSRGREIRIKNEISKEEYDRHVKEMSSISYYTRLKEIHILTSCNSREFLNFMKLVRDNDKSINKLSSKELVREGNRLLINTLTAIGMFIDYCEKEMGKALGKQSREEFRKMTNIFYDGLESYRFIVLMRDYAVHYSFPIHSHIKSLDGVSGLFSNKNTLLKFKKWKHAKADIEKMPGRISLSPHIEIMEQCINEFFDQCLYKITPTLNEVIQYVTDLVQDNDGKSPVFVAFESEEKLREGKCTLFPMDLKIFQDALEDLKRHPKIEIEDVSTPTKLETILEFYLDNKLIMEGPVSSFKDKNTAEKGVAQDKYILSLGDRFELADYPETGNVMMVRIMSVENISNQLNGDSDRIRYYLEPYVNS